MNQKKSCHVKYRRCFVNLCKNSQLKTPDKLFINVPRETERRKLWFRLANRTYVPTKTKYFVCEDHFDLKEDMQNYSQYKMMGGKIFMKKHAIPHIFDCEPQNTKVVNVKSSSAFKALNRKDEINLTYEKSNPLLKMTDYHSVAKLLGDNTLNNQQQFLMNKEASILNILNYSNIPTINENGIFEEITVYRNSDQQNQVEEEFIIPDQDCSRVNVSIPNQPKILGQQSYIKEELIIPDE